MFTNEQRSLIRASLEIYKHEIATACLEDQGVKEGMPGTFGHETQVRITELLAHPDLRML